MAELPSSPRLRPSSKYRNRVRLAVEELEPRNLPSGAPAPFDPQQIAQAYGFNLTGLTGSRQTIAIVDAYNDPNIQRDVATFDRTFGLAGFGPGGPSLSVVNQNGSTSRLPATNADWDLEISLDVEWAHAIAPQANILLVEANSSYTNDLMAGVKYAAAHANVVSMSWGSGDFSGEQAYDSVFAAYPNVTFVASSGDNGTVNWPAVSPDVLSVGGTSLTINTNGSYGGETTWNNSYGSSGGGASQYEPAPSYQQGITGSSFRTTPDVAYNADPNTGVYMYDSVRYQGYSGWYAMGGTSAGAPQWAGLIARADQGRAANHLAPLGTTQTLTALYSLNNTPGYFHDITSGSNQSGQKAGTGYDRVTGLGSPIANNLVPFLAAYNTAAPSNTGYSAPSGQSSSPSKPATHHDESIPVSAPTANVSAVPPTTLTGLNLTGVSLTAAPTPASNGPFTASVGVVVVGTPGTAALPSSNGVEGRSTGTGGTDASDDLLPNEPMPLAPEMAVPPNFILPPMVPDAPVVPVEPETVLSEATPAGTLAEIGSTAVLETADGIRWSGWGQNAPRTLEMGVLAAAFAGLWGGCRKHSDARRRAIGLDGKRRPNDS